MRKLLFLLLALSASSLQAATITYGAASGNWSDATKWVGAATPTASDDVLITVASGAAVTIDTSTCVAKSLTCTGYTGNIRFNASQTLSVSGSVLFAATHTLTGTGTLLVNATGTLTSAGLVFPGNLTFNAAGTYTLGDDWQVTGSVTTATGAAVINSNTLRCDGTFTHSSATSGTSTIRLGGTGTWFGGGALSNNLTINTSGIVTLGSTINYGTGVITYTAGTISNPATSTLFLLSSSSPTLNTSGMSWGSIRLANGASVTLTSNLSCAATLGQATGSAVSFSGNFDITCGTLSMAANDTLAIVSGRTLTVTTSIILAGYDLQACALRSVTAPFPFFLNFTGPVSGVKIWMANFTDVDASGSTAPIWNYNGSTLTRTTNIQNVTLPTTMGYVYQ